MLTRSEMVLDSFQEYGDWVLFCVRDGELVSKPQFELSREKFEDMGSPLRVTVTVVPGDRLNVGDV